MHGKQDYFCHQGKDYNKGKQDEYIEKKNIALTQDHVFKEAEIILNQQKNWTVHRSSALKKFTGLHPTKSVLTPKMIEKKLIKI